MNMTKYILCLSVALLAFAPPLLSKEIKFKLNYELDKETSNESSKKERDSLVKSESFSYFKRIFLSGLKNSAARMNAEAKILGGESYIRQSYLPRIDAQSRYLTNKDNSEVKLFGESLELTKKSFYQVSGSIRQPLIDYKSWYFEAPSLEASEASLRNSIKWREEVRGMQFLILIQNVKIAEKELSQLKEYIRYLDFLMEKNKSLKTYGQVREVDFSEIRLRKASAESDLIYLELKRKQSCSQLSNFVNLGKIRCIDDNILRVTDTLSLEKPGITKRRDVISLSQRVNSLRYKKQAPLSELIPRLDLLMNISKDNINKYSHDFDWSIGIELSWTPLKGLSRPLELERNNLNLLSAIRAVEDYKKEITNNLETLKKSLKAAEKRRNLIRNKLDLLKEHKRLEEISKNEGFSHIENVLDTEQKINKTETQLFKVKSEVFILRLRLALESGSSIIRILERE